MIQVVIIDDEENSRESLKGKLDLFCPEVEISAEADSVKDGIAAITSHKPDAVFLDIKLAGESGFDILDEVAKNKDLNPEIVFITAHDEFA
ncbi:MAG: LytR/AlgR family response regulator transcription factor, partial [Owenweeksia sp.]